jgi:phosphohistidine swiveling domain-containing protein
MSLANSDYINLIAASCAAASAALWALSSRVNIRTGYDMDKEMAEDLKKAARLNAWGAAFASVAALITAAKVVPWLAWMN